MNLEDYFGTPHGANAVFIWNGIFHKKNEDFNYS